MNCQEKAETCILAGFSSAFVATSSHPGKRNESEHHNTAIYDLFKQPAQVWRHSSCFTLTAVVRSGHIL